MALGINAKSLQPLIGKPIFDLYSRIIGNLVSFSTDNYNEVLSIDVAQHSGSVVSFANSQLLMRNGELYVIPTWKLEAETVKKEYMLIARRLKALDELHQYGEVMDDVYKEFYSQYAGQLKSLEEKRRRLGPELKNRLEELEGRIRSLQIALAKIKIYKVAGDLETSSYEATKRQIEAELNRTAQEKGDIEKTLAESCDVAVGTAAFQDAPTAEGKEEAPPAGFGESRSVESPPARSPVVVRIKDEEGL